MAGKTTKAQLYSHMQSQHAERQAALDSFNRQGLFEAHGGSHAGDGGDNFHRHEGLTKTRVGRTIPGTGFSGGPMAGQDIGDDRSSNSNHPANRERNKELARRNA
jgi:hypothetical protein